MALDARLLEILACPVEKGPLYYFEPGVAGGEGGFLFCPACRRRYEVRDDIPVMLLDEATTLSEAEAEAVLARAAELGVQPTFTP
ncbi:MAG TPA: Trm112 family protein [Acidimicrobiia bacterium]|jgi:uncharacterized protein YbaR (Trm112 family)|nr:uncharacterized protein [Actinomycetota bacterium]HEV7687688.1 Trm112 family protein [Acidimicrobiia bacterium]